MRGNVEEGTWMWKCIIKQVIKKKKKSPHFFLHTSNPHRRSRKRRIYDKHWVSFSSAINKSNISQAVFLKQYLIYL